MKAGRILLAILFLVGAAGALVNGAALYTRFLYASILIAALAWGWTQWVARGLAVERSSRVLRANVGDVLEENYKIANRGRLLAPWIEALNLSAIPFAAGSRLFTLVPGKRFRSYTARTWLIRRGSFQLGPTRVTAGDPFGLFTAGRQFESKDTLVVFPMIHQIHSFPSPQGMLTGGPVIRRKSADITPHAAGVREYVHGDAMKRIHWHTSARRGRLMVKEFEQDPQAEVWLYLDSHRFAHHQKEHKETEIPFDGVFLVKRPKIELPPSTLEYCVSAAASLAHYYIRQGRAVGYASAGQVLNILPAERSERQEAKILETLAFVKADGDLSLAGLVATQAALLPQGSSVILITSTTRPELLLAVDELIRHFLSPVIVLLDAKTFGGPSSSADLLASLRERRAPVIPVSCGDDLSQALSAIPTNFKPQDSRAWQTPVSSPLT